MSGNIYHFTKKLTNACLPDFIFICHGPSAWILKHFFTFNPFYSRNESTVRKPWIHYMVDFCINYQSLCVLKSCSVAKIFIFPPYGDKQHLMGS